MILLLLLPLVLFPGQDASDHDVITLLDGKTLTGVLEGEDEDAYRFRIITTGGKVSYVRLVPKRHVFETHWALRQGGLDGTPLTPSDGAPDTPSAPDNTIEDKEEYLREIVAEWNTRNVDEAAMRLVRLINQASAEDLVHLELVSQALLKMPLAEFAAEVHMTYALLRSKDGYFRLFFVKPFHLQELRARLVLELERALRAEVCATGPQTGSGRSSAGHSIAAWLRRPLEYNASGEQGACFEKHVTRVLGMNRELVNLAQLLNDAPERIQELHQQRSDLRRLFAVVNSRREMGRSGR